MIRAPAPAPVTALGPALGLAFGLVLTVPSAVPGPVAAQTMTSGTVAELRGLDRVSGQTTDLSLPVGGQGRLARLEISVLGCRYPADNPNADAFAFLEITDSLRGERLFLGWMIASAPALNALDHPRYDIWVLGCRQGSATSTTGPAETACPADPGPAPPDPAPPEPAEADAAAPQGAAPLPVTRSIVPPRRPAR
jgi:hypothetical protein